MLFILSGGRVRNIFAFAFVQCKFALMGQITLLDHVNPMAALIVVN